MDDTNYFLHSYYAHAFLRSLLNQKDEYPGSLTPSYKQRRRKAAFQKVKLSGDPQDLAKYKQLRNRVLNLLRECRQAFFSNLDSANAKDFWKAVNKMLGTKSTTFPSISNGTAQADTGQAW